MTKSLTKKFKRITSIALAMMMLVSMALPGFAEEVKYTTAAITKELYTPVGTANPNFTFEFEVKGISEDDIEADELDVPMPVVGDNGKIEIDMTGAIGYTDKGITVYKKESKELFTGVNWLHAGVYVYEVTEKINTIDLKKTDVDDKGNEYETDELRDELTYSIAKYKLTVMVAGDGADPEKFYVDSIYADRIVADGEDETGKVDPEPKDGEDDEYSGMTFANIFVKNHGGGVDPQDPEDPKDPKDPDPETIDEYTVFKLFKTVTGQFGNKSKPFSFTVKLEKAKIGVEDSRTYYAYKMEKQNGVSVIVGERIDFKGNAGAASETVYLTHGQWLAFINMPVGTYFQVEEKGEADYVANYQIIIAGINKGGVTQPSDNKGADLGMETMISIGEGKVNNVEFTNVHVTNPTTGISVDNLPYIVMIAAAMFALAALIVIKYRKGSKASA